MSKPTDAGDTRPPARFTHTIRVGWAHCDPAEIAYTGHIPNFALDTLDTWWMYKTGFGWFQLHGDRRTGAPFVHMSLDFRSPITPRHPLECDVKLLKIGGTSVRHRVTGYQDGVLCFEGEFVAVFVDADHMTPRTIPDDIRAKIQPEVEA